MAFLYISEFSALGFVGAAPTQLIQAPFAPALAEQQVAIATSSAASSAFSASTKFIRLNTDAVCSIAFGSTGAAVASTTAHRMSANSTEFYAVNPGTFVSVIANT